MNLPKLDPTKTILTITVGFCILFLFLDIDLFLYIAIGVGIAGLLSNYLAEKITWLWSVLSWVLSLIVPNILLSIIFYVILFPLAILVRVFGKKNMLFLKNPEHSLFKDKATVITKDSFEKLW